MTKGVQGVWPKLQGLGFAVEGFELVIYGFGDEGLGLGFGDYTSLL